MSRFAESSVHHLRVCSATFELFRRLLQMKNSKSAVWTHFEETTGADGRKAMLCKRCHRPLQGRLASNAKRHLKTYHKELSESVEAADTKSSGGDENMVLNVEHLQRQVHRRIIGSIFCKLSERRLAPTTKHVRWGRSTFFNSLYFALHISFVHR